MLAQAPEWKWNDFNWNLTEVYFQETNKKYSSIGSDL